MDQNTLIREAKNGDQKSLSKLLQANYKMIFGYLIKMTSNEEMAKDLTQETMVKAILNIKKFKGKSKFSTWLISIANNIHKDVLKKNKYKKVNIDKTFIESNEGLEEYIIIKDKIYRLKLILEKLPYDKKQVFILKHYYNYSYKEISKIAKCPVGTVRSRLHYAITFIKEEMEKYDYI